MEQNLTQLCDLDPILDDLKIVARCISIWKAYSAGNPKDVWSLDCVLQEAQVVHFPIRSRGMVPLFGFVFDVYKARGDGMLSLKYVTRFVSQFFIDRYIAH
uniref:Replication protein A 70 kDa DNA-binding subunit B n=1 Tax=Tanacetum cinerariifolium TaxID=118510 RepID=A0A699J6I7_TANCI|nr:replication protein A 70 kDa DNA-binding subunit B [Tanacetum cinerariifolium]